jgi:hypothetical protein
MKVKSISGTVTTPIVLGTGQYGSRLTITDTGAVLIPTGGDTAITAPHTVSHAIVINAGLVEGGAGSAATLEPGHLSGQGGNGILLDAGGAIKNTGSILGGAGGTYVINNTAGNGGAGIMITDIGKVTNSGTIGGGTGATNYNTYYGGAGGIGVDLAGGGTLTNHGVITGGAGGGAWVEGGIGGAGVALGGQDTLTNTGIITGGSGGYTYLNGFATGGAGVYINGGTLTAAAGLIAGGAPGIGGGSQGDAVVFGATAGTLIVDPGAKFSGDIVANTNDTLVLAGSGAGKLSGFGTSVTGFTTITENSGADWTLNGTINGTGTLTVGSGGTLSLDGTVSIKTILFAAGGQETLALGTPSAVTSTFAGFGTGDQIDLAGVQATSLKYAEGILTLFDANHSVVDTLAFSGQYTQADFSLQAKGNDTDVLYDGTPAHLPDFLPGDAIRPEASWAGSMSSAPERFFATPHEQWAPNWGDFQSWHNALR